MYPLVENEYLLTLQQTFEDVSAKICPHNHRNTCIQTVLYYSPLVALSLVTQYNCSHFSLSNRTLCVGINDMTLKVQGLGSHSLVSRELIEFSMKRTSDNPVVLTLPTMNSPPSTKMCCVCGIWQYVLFGIREI